MRGFRVVVRCFGANKPARVVYSSWTLNVESPPVVQAEPTPLLSEKLWDVPPVPPMWVMVPVQDEGKRVMSMVWQRVPRNPRILFSSVDGSRREP